MKIVSTYIVEHKDEWCKMHEVKTKHGISMEYFLETSDGLEKIDINLAFFILDKD